MLEKLNLKDLPGWVIVTFSGVIGVLFWLFVKAKDDLRLSEIEHKKELAACREEYQKRVDNDLSEWKASYAALKKEQDEKLNELRKIRRK